MSYMPSMAWIQFPHIDEGYYYWDDCSGVQTTWNGEGQENIHIEQNYLGKYVISQNLIKVA